MLWYRRGGSSVCAHRSLHQMKALVISMWGLCTIDGMIRVARELDCFSAHILLREPDKSEDKAEKVKVAIKEAKENKIGTSPAIRWRRPYMRVVVERGEEVTTHPVGLSYPKEKYRLERRWTRRSTTVPQRRIYRSRRKGYRCKETDSRAMGLAAPWYHRHGTFVESSIPCSHGGRALVVKGAKEVENAKVNSKYQDRSEGQRSRNFIRLVSMGFSSR
ncbi:hypothetical protein GW17_00011174 [Ensete ventricosum]|nr:hypothetical protein GW17_00011174 [Ensete ventricosum]